MAGGIGHVVLHNTHNNEIIALATKLGTGASTPTSGKVLRGTGTGTSAWGLVDLSTDVSGSLPIANLAGILPIAKGGTGTTTSTGSGNTVLSDTPTLTTPKVDVINEATSGSGVTVDGLLIKDSRPQGWDGWQVLPGTLTYASNNGNKEYVLTSSTDLTSVLSLGTRLRMSRTTAPPTQCVDLESSLSQYASNGSITGTLPTTAITVEAWIKLESYTFAYIFGSMTLTNGFALLPQTDGRIMVSVRSGGNDRSLITRQSVPLSQWVHVAAAMNVATGTGAIYFDGIEVTSVMSGTITSIGSSTAVRLGHNQLGGVYYDGKISDLRVWRTVRTQTEVRDYMNKQLVGNEANLFAYYKLDGNFNDSTSNANHLTASGGAVATDADSPMKSTEYAIVTQVGSSSITVFTGTDYGVPNDTLTNLYYSTEHAPQGFPPDKNRWKLNYFHNARVTTTAVQGAVYNLGSINIRVPTGSWRFKASGTSIVTNTVSGAYLDVKTFFSASSSTHVPVGKMPMEVMNGYQTSTTEVGCQYTGVFGSAENTAMTPVYVLLQTNRTSGTPTLYQDRVIFEAELAYA